MLTHVLYVEYPFRYHPVYAYRNDPVYQDQLHKVSIHILSLSVSQQLVCPSTQSMKYQQDKPFRVITVVVNLYKRRYSTSNSFANRITLTLIRRDRLLELLVIFML